MKKLLAIMIILTLGILITNAYSRTITVGHGASCDYQTITAARAAQVGDVILVADGTYSEGKGEVFPIDVSSSITGNPRGGVYGGPYNCGWGEPTSPTV